MLTSAAVAMGPVKWGTMPTKWVSQRAMIFEHLGDAADVGEGGADEVDVMMLDEGVEVPAIAPLFSGGEGDVDLLAEDGQVLLEGFGADGVFDEEGGEVFDFVAAADGFVEIEALVEVDAPFAVFADTFAGGGALFAEMRDALAGVVGGVGGKVHGAEAEGAVAGLDGEAGAVFDSHAGGDAGDDAGGVVALAVVADHAAEKLVDGEVLDLALDVPEGEVECADGVCAFAAGGIEEGAVHVLPEALDVLGVAADEAAGGGGKEVFGAAFADAGDAGVGLDGDDDVALVEEGRGVGRVVGADARDLHFGQGGEGEARGCGGGEGGGGEGLQEFAAVHGRGLRFGFTS